MTIYKFMGGGYLYGAPARDMKEKEWAKLPKQIQEAGLVSGLYERVETKPQDKQKGGGK